MFYALVMLVTINGHASQYVIDQLANAEDCSAALRHARPASVYNATGVNAAVSFRCEATHLVRKDR